MLGSIAGDIIGSVHEWSATKTKDFPLFTAQSSFTDDSVLTFAVAHQLLDPRGYADAFPRYVAAYPDRGYGGRFQEWVRSGNRQPYGSYGNGSAMRVSPVAYAFESLEYVLAEALRSAAATHDHPEGIRGAQAVAAAVFLARKGASKSEIRNTVQDRFKYDLRPTLAAIRPTYSFDEPCQGSVPQALIAFLEAADYEDAIRNAISLGGDADTLACIAGGIAEAHFGLPPAVGQQALARLPESLRAVYRAFRHRFPSGATQ